MFNCTYHIDFNVRKYVLTNYTRTHYVDG
jgi:hypothetical protein